MSNSLRLVDSPDDLGEAFASRFEAVLSLTEANRGELAIQCDVTPRTVYDWTQGVVPFKANLAALERATSFSPAFLIAPWPAPVIEGLNYWARTKAPKYRRAGFAAYSTVVGHVYRHVDSIPPLKIDQGAAGTLGASPADAAAAVRDLARLGEAPVDTIALAESLGVVITWGHPAIFELDGFSAWIDGVPTIVLNPARVDSLRADPFRIWHTVGHELGHLFMHDRAIGAIATSSPQREAEAESFAMALRMPATGNFDDALQKSVRTYGWDALSRLSNLYKVPIRDLLTVAKERQLESVKYIDQRAIWATSDGIDLVRTSKTPAVPPLTLLSSGISDLCSDRGCSIDEFAREIGIPARYVGLMAAESIAQVDFERIQRR